MMALPPQFCWADNVGALMTTFTPPSKMSKGNLSVSFWLRCTHPSHDLLCRFLRTGFASLFTTLFQRPLPRLHLSRRLYGTTHPVSALVRTAQLRSFSPFQIFAIPPQRYQKPSRPGFAVHCKPGFPSQRPDSQCVTRFIR
jgi:hypothetical protein